MRQERTKKRGEKTGKKGEHMRKGVCPEHAAKERIESLERDTHDRFTWCVWREKREHPSTIEWPIRWESPFVAIMDTFLPYRPCSDPLTLKRTALITSWSLVPLRLLKTSLTTWGPIPFPYRLSPVGKRRMPHRIGIRPRPICRRTLLPFLMPMISCIPSGSQPFTMGFPCMMRISWFTPFRRAPCLFVTRGIPIM